MGKFRRELAARPARRVGRALSTLLRAGSTTSTTKERRSGSSDESGQHDQHGELTRPKLPEERWQHDPHGERAAGGGSPGLRARTKGIRQLHGQGGVATGTHERAESRVNNDKNSTARCARMKQKAGNANVNGGIDFRTRFAYTLVLPVNTGQKRDLDSRRSSEKQ